MNRILLFHILENIWLVFGAYWIGTSLLKRNSAAPVQRQTWWRAGFLGVTLLALFLGRHKIPPLLIVILAIACAALGLYWTTTGSAAAHSREFRFYRWIRLLVLAVVFLLLFWNRTGISMLGENFLPTSMPAALVGFTAALVGLATAVWARISLGRFWSDKVVVQQDHQLIRTGPYSRMRHPIYSGVLLAVVGTAVLIGEWRGLLAFLLLLINYIIKARKEDQLLSQEFGPAFSDHAGRAGFLLPRMRPL